MDTVRDVATERKNKRDRNLYRREDENTFCILVCIYVCECVCECVCDCECVCVSVSVCV